MSTSMKDKETKGFGRIAKRIRGLIEDFVVSLTIDSLDGDGRAEILKRLIREIEQLEQEAERRGYEKGIIRTKDLERKIDKLSNKNKCSGK